MKSPGIDEFIQRIKSEVEKEPDSHKGFTIYQGNLLYKGRLVIPATSPLLPEIMAAFHDSPIGGHGGEKKTYLRMAVKLYWQGMRTSIGEYVKNCQVCQTHKALNTSPTGLLQPIPIPSQTWDEVTMDFIEGLPKSGGWDTIWVVVDRLTKYAHFIPLKHPFTTSKVAGEFIKQIVRLHGFPSSIISDRDTIFLSQLWKELL